jgi:hypothetical protein
MAEVVPELTILLAAFDLVVRAVRNLVRRPRSLDREARAVGIEGVWCSVRTTIRDLEFIAVTSADVAGAAVRPVTRVET